MSKNKNQERKAELAARAKNESFRFQVEFAREKCGVVESDSTELQVELDAICNNGLVDAMLCLRDIIVGVRKELGVEPEMEKCSLNSTLVPFILGITRIAPGTGYVPGKFIDDLPLQVSIGYDNQIRNQVVDWVKAHYDGVTTRLGQPILKLPNMVVDFRRVLKS